MPLHRDIFWVGRQWAVTGHGMQLIDQKLKGYFDIEIARVWDDDLADELLAKTWINAADFNRGLEVARARYPEPSHGAAPDPGALGSPVRAPVDPEPPKLERPSRGEPPPLAALPLHDTAPIRPPEPEPATPKLPVKDVVREHRILSLLESVLSETPKPQPPKPAELSVQAAPPQQRALNAQDIDPIERSESEPPKFDAPFATARPEESVFRFGDSAPVEPPKPVPLAPESPKLLQPLETPPPKPNYLRVQGAVAVRPAASEPVKPVAHEFSMHVPRWPAKFVAIWRVRGH